MLRYPASSILRFFLLFTMIGAASATALIVVSHLLIEQERQRTFSSPAAVPAKKAALVLGCAHKLGNGRTNLFFVNRIDAAAELFHHRKCEYLIVSGDNGRSGYDEPTDMRDALIRKGVPPERIYRDYAGFSTLDSVIRAREIFGQNELIIVSQAFHNERALFIARRRGFGDVAGFNADEVKTFGAFRTKLRELIARAKTLLDVTILRRQPKFLGEKVVLGGPVT